MIPYADRLRKLSVKTPAAQPAPPVATPAVLDTVARLVADVLALPEERLDCGRSFSELGVNSLLAVRLLDRINRAFHLRLGVETLFSHGDPRRLAAHVAALIPTENGEREAALATLSGERAPLPAMAKSLDPTPADESAIAIIGYAGRFAAAPDPEALWQALRHKRSLLSEMPACRRREPTIPPPRAGFLIDAERFDAAFFGLSPREAAAMDPVQRQFLEQAWQALEHAGLTRAALAGRTVGVYAGAAGSGYDRAVPLSGKAMDAYIMTGNLPSMTAARLAYFLDLDGPAVTVDTACSSSLMAVHLACQALLAGEVDIAISGGASLFIDERPFEAMARAGMTSASGACRPFDDAADGIAVAEAAACVILKPLTRALADGDRVDAVIRASHANQDGRSNGITAPSALAQARLLRATLEKAGIPPGSVDLIETHGTGTRLGDPIEAAALREVYGDRAPARPLWVTALKGAIGHASEAAGIGGLIAALLAIRHREFPPITGFSVLNAHLAAGSAGDGRLQFSSQSAPWPEPAGHPRRAGVSSFGLSGTNVHLILEEPPASPAPAAPTAADAEWLFVLSAATPEDLARRGADLVAWLEQHPAIRLPDLAQTLLFHREPMVCRWGALASSITTLMAQLATMPASDPADRRLAQWLAGAAPSPDWLPLPHRPPLALLGYPFHGPRLWGGQTLPEPGDAQNPPHPLLGERQPDGGFLRTFTAEEPWVADHRVGGQALLHAAVLLEMIHAAAEHLAPEARVEQISWLQPLVIGKATPVRISVEKDLLSIGAAGVTHVTARLAPSTPGTPATTLVVEALWDSLPATTTIPGDDPAGVFLGPSFPGPDRLRASRTEALAYLEQAPAQGLTLPLSLLDAAIRTAAAVVAGAEPSGPRLRFPARMAALRQWAPLPERGFWLHARRLAEGDARAVERLDVKVYDRQGKALLELNGLALAAASASEVDSPVVLPTQYFSWRVVWRETPVVLHGQRDNEADLIVADPGDPWAESLHRRYPAARRLDFSELAAGLPDQLSGLPERPRVWFISTGSADRTTALLLLLKALATEHQQSAVVLRIITRGALAALPGETPEHSGDASLLGLGKSASREFPAWRVRLIDLDPVMDAGADLWDRLLGEPGDALGEPVALRGSLRLTQGLEPLAGDGECPPIPLARGDHVILVGGAGRLGRLVAHHLARRHGARLSLIGRSAPDENRLALLQELEQCGGQARYYAADLTDRAALSTALDQALGTFGPATLMIQAAVDPAFARIERAAVAEFQAALAPKVTGLRHLGEALTTRPIAALAVFSSIGAFTGFPANDGQASYCAACSFEASHARQIAHAVGKPVRVIHWGLWDTGDYPPDALARMRAAGLFPMDPEGLGGALEKLLETASAQVVHAHLSPGAWLDLGAPADALHCLEAPLAELARNALAAAPGTPSNDANLTLATEALSRRIDAGLGTIFAARGFRSGEALTIAEARHRLAVLPRHQALAGALLNMAVRRGFAHLSEGRIQCRDWPWQTLPEIAPPEAETGFAAALRLLDRCLDALPAVLAGEMPATDVLFPAGSMEWVEPIYRDQPILADCGQRLAAAVVAVVAGGGRRILEIGAGTGSTTGPVLDALHAAGLEERSHYLYTDLSRAFVRHGQTRFGNRLGAARVLDIARPPETQGIDTGAWDIIIASNVLHATPDIRDTLSHVAGLLAPGGIVLINEMVDPDDFATLTFGLLDGWWETRDPECRLADGPILGIPGWRAALRCVGLQGRWAFDHRGRAELSAGGQALVLAFKPPTDSVIEIRTATLHERGQVQPSPTPLESDNTAAVPADRAGLEATLRNLLAAILDLPADGLERDRPFMEIGVDSLIAPQIAEEVQALLGCPLRVTDIYRHGNLAALATHLLTAFPDQIRWTTTAPVQGPNPEDGKPLPTPLPQPAGREPADDHSRTPDAIAIIGLSVRYAGAPDLDAFWRLLDEGRDAITPVDRFNLAPWFDPEGGTGKTYARWGGFLADHDRFDPYFFNITPAEAEVMDPQQRVLMEETWKALENAGLNPETLSGGRCGLFIGASANNYQATEGGPGLRTLGGSMAILSARMAYVLNLRGPNFPIDTGCSSSLVAVHQACQSLRSGECDLALAGGVSVNLIAPDIFLYLADAGMASRSGASRTFDDAADGFVPGEGAGVLVLKPLADALADGDRIEAVIAGSGINQDGRTAGLTAPSAEAQTALALEIYRRHGLDPAEFGLIEAHGTGTRLGDPIEVQALTEAFRHYTDHRGGCAIGSVKTNIGHTMAAAGMAGIAKAVLALRHRRIPASLNFETPNRHIDFADSPFFVPTATMDWPEGRALKAAVSSFGFSGTNAHVVLTAAPPRALEPAPVPGPWLFAVSARDAAALRRRLTDLTDWLRQDGQTADLARVAETLARGRAHWRFRRALLAANHAELLTALERAAAAEPPIPIDSSHIPALVGIQPGAEGLQGLALAYEAGDLPDWSALFGPRRAPLALPGYSFARERFWAMPQPDASEPAGYPINPDHLLLAAHRIGGSLLLPGALSLELLRGEASGITGAAWLRPLAAADTPTRLQVIGADTVELVAANGAVLARGRRELKPPTSTPTTLTDFIHSTRLEGPELYTRFAGAGFDYGAALQVVDWVEIGPGAAHSRLTPPANAALDALALSAALLDGALQTAAAIGHADPDVRPDGQWVPQQLGALRVWRRPAGPCFADARLEPGTDPDSLSFTVQLRDSEGALLAAFEGMTARRLASGTPAAPQIYVLTWQPTPVEAGLPTPAAIAMAGWNAPLESALRRSFPATQLVSIAPEDDAEALAKQLAALPAPLLVMQILPDGQPADPMLTVSNGLAALDPLPASRDALRLTRALLLAARTDGDRLLTVARGTPSTPTGLTAAAIAGFYRTLRLEAPALDARVLLGDPEANLAEAVLSEFPARPARDPFLHYTADLTRHHASWEPLADMPPCSQLPAGVGAVVISGGLGGIGLALAERLTAEGATSLALLSRSPPSPAAQAAIRALERSGAAVLTLEADVGDPRALAKALRAVRDTLGPITAVYHLAGVLRDGYVLNKSEQELADVFAAKTRGAVLLDLLTRNDPLEAFVLFGSTAAAFGSTGQADYAAANAFLAAFADYRRVQSGPTLCVAWPLWAGGGMRPPAATADYLAEIGMTPLPTSTGFDLLARLLAAGVSGALALYGRPGLFERLRAVSASPGPVAQLPLPPGASFRYLCELLTAVTKLPRERIEPDAPFEELGIDSIAIMKLNRQLEIDLGPVAKTLFFEYRTTGALAAHLSQTKGRELAARLNATASPASVTTRPMPAPAPRPSAVNAVASPIAIVGIAGLYPMAEDLDSFWNNLSAGRDCIREIPPERWPLAGFYDPDRDRPATSHCKWGGFIEGADHFDARFFGIAPLEAETLDPQARKFLEVCWNALEDAGLDPERMFDGLPEAERTRRACGVFVGVMYGDYQLFGPEEAQKGNLIGPNADYWNIANRVSAFLDLHGPSLAVDTACSSSLSAIHLACQAIRVGDCDLAIAGGVNLCLHPRRHWILSKAGMAASDGRCHSFGADGDGYVPGEGIGAVVLKSLARARADGDRIHGVILGSALNHGGRTSGYTVPNPIAQGEAVAAALNRSGIDPRSISYIEAHGTGTPLGDPIEIRGLARAFQHAMPQDCAIGSVKANIGHLESAAGIAGLTKVLLQMRERTLAPTLHAEPPNPGIDFGGTGFRIATRREPWQGPPGTPLRAGISSFGAGGANAHVIVEAPSSESRAMLVDADSDAPVALLLSARDEEALRRLARQLAAHLVAESGRQQSLRDIAHTLANGRKAFAHRLAVTGQTHAELAASLNAFGDASGQTKGLWSGLAGKPLAAIVSTDPAELAATWVAGAHPPDLPGRRVALPGYPFAQRRLWVKRSEASASVAPKQRDSRNATHHFASDQPPLADHRIGGRLLLPGAASLRLALTAAEGSILRDIRWPAPGVAAAGEILAVRVNRDGDRITVHAADGNCLLTARTAAPGDEPASIDLPNWVQCCPEQLDSATVYAALARAGAEYGPSLQVLETVRRGDGLCLAHLSLTGTVEGILDAAFQLCFALVPKELSGVSLLPAGMGRIALKSALENVRTIAATRRGADGQGVSIDFQLLDTDGLLVGWIADFRARSAVPPVTSAASATPSAEEPPLRLLRPEWTPLVPPADSWMPSRPWVLTEQAKDPLALALAQTWGVDAATLANPPDGSPDAVVIVLGATTADPRDAALRTGQLLESLLDSLQGWSRLDSPPALLLLTREAHETSGLGAPGAAVAAFLRAAARERQDWRVIALDLPTSAWATVADGGPLPQVVLSALPQRADADAAPTERIWRDGVLSQRILAPVTLPAVPSPWRDGDVLLIAGAGGLGGLLARHAAKSARVSVALLGRSAEPNPPTAAALAELRAKGRPACYVQADLSDADAVTGAVSQVTAELGPIAWIAHTALIMGDAPLTELTPARLHRVLGPKTLGLAHLANAVRPTRGLLVFSSSNALTANPGQAAYAAASAFVDAMALSLPCPVHVLDWGYWGETGAVADASHQAQLARLGVLPIRDQEGLEALERVIGVGLPRAAVLRVSERLLEPMGIDTRRAVHWRGEPPALALAEPATASARALQTSAEPFDDPAVAVLNAYAARRLWLALDELGVPMDAGQPLDGASLTRALNARPDYAPLMEALAELLQRAGFADAERHSTGQPRRPGELAQERLRLESEAPATAPTLTLLETCLRALGDVVAGRREAAEVLFQGGDSAAVAALYRGNPVVDHFQRLTAEAVAGAVRALPNRSNQRPARILEVGAGTGGTTEFVLAALAGLDGWRYRLTDLGASLSAATAERLDPERRLLESGRLDVSLPLTGQGIAPGSIDVVIAANVLHATADLFAVLGNLKEALAPGGLLILNEATSHQDINTLTFGLTPGWWAFRDSPRRCPHGPLLDPPRWNRLLAESGYAVAGCFGLPLARGGEHPLQSVIVAAADRYAPDLARHVSMTAGASKAPAAAAPPASAANSSGLEHSLRKLIAETLRLDDGELGDDDSFADHGADSILSVELVRRINAEYGVDLKSTTLFNYSTVRELAGYMAREHGVAASPETMAEATTGEARQKTRRLLEVINRRREAAPVNREAEFWSRQAKPAATDPASTGSDSPSPPLPPANLDEVLRRLERGELSVIQALELNYVDE